MRASFDDLLVRHSYQTSRQAIPGKACLGCYSAHGQRLSGSSPGVAGEKPRRYKLNSDFIKRLNATFRSRLAVLVHRSRSLIQNPETSVPHVYLRVCVYNLCEGKVENRP